MKRLFYAVMAILLALSLAACGGNASNEDQGTGGLVGPASSADADDTTGDGTGGPMEPMVLENVTEMLEVQDWLFDFHRDAISEDAFLLSALQVFGAPFSFYFAMFKNDDNEDGKFGDISSDKGFIEKQGSRYTIGKEYVVEESFGLDEEGDIHFESGEADIDEGWIWNETSVKRGGVTIKSERNDQQFFLVGTASLKQEMNQLEYFGSPVTNCTARFLIITEGSLKYVTGSYMAEEGEAPGFMSFDPAMTIEQSRAMFESNGYEIERFGIVEGGQITAY